MVNFVDLGKMLTHFLSASASLTLGKPFGFLPASSRLQWTFRVSFALQTTESQYTISRLLCQQPVSVFRLFFAVFLCFASPSLKADGQLSSVYLVAARKCFHIFAQSLLLVNRQILSLDFVCNWLSQRRLPFASRLTFRRIVSITAGLHFVNTPVSVTETVLVGRIRYSQTLFCFGRLTNILHAHTLCQHYFELFLYYFCKI
jgi:hypothetical protein